MNIYIWFFLLSYKKCNKLDEYIYTYIFIILIIPLNNFFYNKRSLFVSLKKYLDYFFCYIVGIEINNHD